MNLTKLINYKSLFFSFFPIIDNLSDFFFSILSRFWEFLHKFFLAIIILFFLFETYFFSINIFFNLSFRTAERITFRLIIFILFFDILFLFFCFLILNILFLNFLLWLFFFNFIIFNEGFWQHELHIKKSAWEKITEPKIIFIVKIMEKIFFIKEIIFER